MNVTEIKEIIAAFDDSKSTYFSLEQSDIRLKLKKEKQVVLQEQETSQQVALIEKGQKMAPISSAESKALGAAEVPEEAGTTVKAPLVGVFYAASGPEAQAYVQVGSQVEKGQVLCLIEAMKMMSEITAPVSGTVEKIYAKNQDLVEFDQPLFLIGD